MESSPNGKIRGRGADDVVGKFTIDGTFNLTGRECRMLKKYSSNQIVYYFGSLNKEGTKINGWYGF